MSRQKQGATRALPTKTNSTSPRKKSSPRRIPVAQPEAATRATRVELVTTAQGRQTTVGLRSLRSGKVLFVCTTHDSRGAEFATLAAERYCVERGYVLIMRAANDTGRDSAAA